VQRTIQGNTQKEQKEPKYKTGDELSYSERNKKNKEIAFMFFFN
jgi:hypothetical protein